jgi:hypothetical protein
MMERFQEARDLAIKKIRVADHMLVMTYPLVQDPKLLLAILENVLEGLTYGMSAILYYERLFKRIPPFQDEFDSKFNMFKSKIVNKHNIDKGYIRLIEELREIIKEHKKSPIEFARKDKFVICSPTYKLKTVSIKEAKDYIAKSKQFLTVMEDVLSKAQPLFNPEKW